MKTNSSFPMVYRAATHRLAVTLVLVLVLGPARESVASILAYEGFNYIVNQLSLIHI